MAACLQCGAFGAHRLPRSPNILFRNETAFFLGAKFVGGPGEKFGE